MKLYMVRHGQSVANFQRRHSGWTQLPLTEQGVLDAKAAGEYLRGVSFDRIYSSDLTRTIQTAQHAIPGCEPIQLPLIREINVGSLTERLVDECYAEYGEPYLAHRAAMDFTPYGGENLDMLTVRLSEFLKILEAAPCENVAAFCHGGIIHAALNLVLGFTIPNSAILCANGSVTILDYTPATSWRLQTWCGKLSLHPIAAAPL